ncbi:MAG: 2-phosphosulfolactate phosphatase [Gaiellaceae bacterium]
MRIDVAFTPEEEVSAPLAIVVDVLRATSTIAQALASGYERVLCAGEIDEARELRRTVPDSLLGGEREARRIEGFDVGASPRELLDARARTLILSTTNGTRAILAAAAHADEVVLGSLLNLDAIVRHATGRSADVAVVCAGFKGAFALDDAYCAGRIVQLLDGERSDAAIAAELVARAFPTALAGLNARTYGPPGLEEDIAFCARESVLEVVPRFSRMSGTAAEIVAEVWNPAGATTEGD